MSNEIKKNEARALPRVRPATDIFEREDGFHVIMDVPGVRKENLVLDLRENELLVSGKTGEFGGAEERYAEVEFGPVEFARTISISDLVDREKISANLKDGVLVLDLPKADKALPRKIEIQAG
ncbi:Hsp20/alpha crystallin family protein [Paucidesulfovibrio longus]|uniref:Hsp20/alpha crystallin family protein n=1 Tax=Paucidesulfovibrio longus TaxID=889 RepID=UPI0003B64B85|nr:Hsp20/alpha crystallin family protein [Paucidesulfovibrio longus]